MKSYRKGVGIFLLNANHQLWVGKRIDFKSNYWQMPQGGIDKNELPVDAMKRELMEEVGISNNYEIIRETSSWLKYKLPTNILRKVWNGKFIGQTQKWFACKFNGNNNEINLNTHYPEFSDWQWIKPDDSLKLVVPFKRKLYRDILEDFKDLYI